MDEFLEKMITNLINKDEELKAKLREKIIEAIDGADIKETLQESIKDAIEYTLDDCDLSESVTKPIKKYLNFTISEALGVKNVKKN
jgi:3-isopropylmalate dehydratase small subunit